MTGSEKQKTEKQVSNTPTLDHLSSEEQDSVKELCKVMMKERAKSVFKTYGHSDDPHAMALLFKIVLLDIMAYIAFYTEKEMKVNLVTTKAAQEYMSLWIGYWLGSRGKTLKEYDILPSEDEIKEHKERMVPILEEQYK